MQGYEVVFSSPIPKQVHVSIGGGVVLEVQQELDWEVPSTYIQDNITEDGKVTFNIVIKSITFLQGDYPDYAMKLGPEQSALLANFFYTRQLFAEGVATKQ